MSFFTSLFAKSATVSVAAQKAGPEFVYPIGSTSGRATNGSDSWSEGNATANFGISFMIRPSR